MTCCKDYVTLWYANKGERADRRCPGSELLEMLSWEYGHEYTIVPTSASMVTHIILGVLLCTLGQ